jgi:hypothetical protein
MTALDVPRPWSWRGKFMGTGATARIPNLVAELDARDG